MSKQPPSKSRQALEAENIALRSLLRSDRFGRALETLFRYGGLVWIAKYCKDGVEALAGRKTVADIGLSAGFDFLGNQSLSVLVAWAAAILFASYGLAQRQRAKNVIKRHTGSTVEREKVIDPNRTSSNLTETGLTNPEDR